MGQSTRPSRTRSGSPIEPALGWTYLSREALARARAQMDEESMGVRDEIGFLTIHQGYADRFFFRAHRCCTPAPAMPSSCPGAALEEVIAVATRLATGEGNPVAAAAEIAAVSIKHRPDCEPLALWLADAVIAHRLNWPAPVPLIASQMARRDLSAAPHHLHGDPAWLGACTIAYARAAATAFDPYAELARHANRLVAVAPKAARQGRRSNADALVAGGCPAGGQQGKRSVEPAPLRMPRVAGSCARAHRPAELSALRALIMGRRPRLKIDFDIGLAELPQELRWREWMGRVEAVIFASPKPVSRETLARIVGPDCNLDLLIDYIRAELSGRPMSSSRSPAASSTAPVSASPRRSGLPSVLTRAQDRCRHSRRRCLPPSPISNRSVAASWGILRLGDQPRRDWSSPVTGPHRC
jgi:hypothetical protein